MTAHLNYNDHNQTMASSGDTQPKAVFGAGNLYTPEEPVLHSFSKTEEAATKLAPIQTLSPPVSPESNTLASFSSVAGLGTYDAPLYPEHTHSDDQHSPLFRSDSRQPSPSKPLSKDEAFAQRAAALGVTNLSPFPLTHYLPPTRQSGRAYYYARMRELTELKEDLRSRGLLPPPEKSAADARDPESQRQVQALARSGNGSQPTGIRKSKPAPKAAASSSRTVRAISPTKAASPLKATTPARRTPRAQNVKEFDDHYLPLPGQQPKHKRAPPTKKVAKEDDSTWRGLKDFCPPVSSLDTAPKPLKAQWKGNPIDNSQEPDRDQLDPREYDLAAELRLRPVQYLANKRRMFIAKVQHLQNKKGFTKTAAQTVTNIDVNKTSKLWEAFDRVGWWDQAWFTEWVGQPTGDEMQ
ncbi:hypothetical protein LTR85_006536 [Meristemomyces frigidus]|nr:hypothetical protein LTR85_006536 [Meristemomyces frigidus]